MDTLEKWMMVLATIAIVSISITMLTLAIWLIGGMAGWWEID